MLDPCGGVSLAGFALQFVHRVGGYLVRVAVHFWGTFGLVTPSWKIPNRPAMMTAAGPVMLL